MEATTQTDIIHAAAFPTYEALAAAHRAGTIGNMDLIRGRRQFGMRYVATNMREQYRRGATRGRRVLAATKDRYRYTDADLAETIARGDAAAPGPYRMAKLLLTLDTVEQRREALRLSHRFLNATPDAGRPSDALAACLAEARRNCPVVAP